MKNAALARGLAKVKALLVLQLVTSGISRTEIARVLRVSVGTVNTWLRQASRILGDL